MPSRLFLAPINTGFALDGKPTAALLRFHADRASPSVGVNMVGNVATRLVMATNPTTCVLSTTTEPEFAAIASEITNRGSVAGIQLAQAPSELNPDRKWRSLDVSRELHRLQEIVRRFTAPQIGEFLDSFAEAAERATNCGFRAVQVHAAHGYLLALLLDEACNVRSDEYRFGSDWVERFVEAMRRRVSRGTLLSFRLSIYTTLRDKHEEFEATLLLARRLARAGIDYLDVSAGFYTVDRTLIYPVASKSSTDIPYFERASIIAANAEIPTVFAGNLRDVRALPSLPENVMVSAARAFMADAKVAEKWAAGDYEQVTKCDRQNDCHYFSRGGRHISCGVNPQLAESTL